MGAYIGAAYWFTSSTSFANPAITIGRMFSGTFAGIAPSSAPAFIAAQAVGGLAGIGIVKMLYPGITPARAAALVVPRETASDEAAHASAAGRRAAATAASDGGARGVPGQVRR